MSLSHVPKQANFETKASAIEGVSNYRYILPATSTGITGGSSSVITFEIPTGINKGFFLDTHNTYLRLRVTPAVRNQTLDPDIGCFISQIQIFDPSGVLLENIQDYSALNSLLKDFSPTSDRISNGAIFSGNNATATTPRIGLALTAGNTYEYSVPLFSSVIGLLNEYFMPLGLMSPGKLRVNITLNALTRACLGATDNTGTYTVNNAYLHLPIIQLPDDVVDSLIRTKQKDGELRIPVNQYESLTSSVASGATSCAVNLPIRKSSLKAIFGISRLTSYLTSYNRYANTCRNNFGGVTSWNYEIDGVQVPNGKVEDNTNTYSQSYGQLLLTLHSLGLRGGDTSMNPTNWVLDDTSAGNTNDTCGGFVFAVDLSKFSNSDGLLSNGMNTLSSTITFNATFTAPAGACTLTFFSLFDSYLVLDLASGTMRLVS